MFVFFFFISRMLTIRNEKQLQCTTKKKEGGE